MEDQYAHQKNTEWKIHMAKNILPESRRIYIIKIFPTEYKFILIE